MPRTQLDQDWDAIITALPSTAFTADQCGSAFGMRLGLAVIAAGMKHKIRYLEVGVRLGHSLAAVCLAAGDELEYAVGIDCFVPGYADEPNSGPEEVITGLAKCGMEDVTKVTIYGADSHTKLRELAKKKRRFNLILLDGDHTETGVEQDLEDAFVLLAVNGTLLLDDCVIKGDQKIMQVWRRFLRGKAEQVKHHHEVLVDQPVWATMTRAKVS